MKKINVCIAGYGYSGSTFHSPLIRSVEALRISQVVSSDARKVHEKLPGVRVVKELEEALADDALDLVIITTPNTTHFPAAKKALEAGKHVVLEKPFVNSVAEGESLLALAAEKGKLLTVFHNRRWDNDFLTIKHLLDKEALGKIYSYEARFDRFRPVARSRWREQDLPGSGALYDLGSHLIDQVLVLFGLPRTVWADLQQQRPSAQTVDYFHLVLGYDRLRVILHAGSLVNYPGPRFQIHGDKGSFLKNGMDSQEDALKKGALPYGPGWGEDPEQNYGALSTDAGGLSFSGHIKTIAGDYAAFYRGLREALLTGAPLPVSAEEALNTIRVIEKAVRSNQEGKVVGF